MKINAKNLSYKELNEALRKSDRNCTITDCLGQRFIASGMTEKNIKITGIPGSALGSYLNGATIEVMGNVQDAVGDTMNDGKIIVHGSVGDAVGYAMRGGEIYIEKNAGYRAGIHIKAYDEKKPSIIIGGNAGSFLGEYQAGGTIVVLGLFENNFPIVSNFCATGMHGGKIFLRSDCKNIAFPKQVSKNKATKEDLEEISKYVENFCKYFRYDKNEILNSYFTVITPNTKNPYKQMYVIN